MRFHSMVFPANVVKITGKNNSGRDEACSFLASDSGEPADACGCFMSFNPLKL